MKKLMSLTAAVLMCLSLLTTLPTPQPCDVDIPEYTEAVDPLTLEPQDESL